MIKNLHDNKGNRLTVIDDRDFVVTDNTGQVTGRFGSYSGAAKSITGYEVNGRRYWKFDAPTTGAVRHILVCEHGIPLEAGGGMTDPDNEARVIHLHHVLASHPDKGLCDADNDRMIPVGILAPV